MRLAGLAQCRWSRLTSNVRPHKVNRADAVADLKSTFAVLNADLDAALAYGRADNTPYAQRALVRAFFALVEGLCYQLRQVTLASLTGSDLLSPAEIAVLREERYSIDDRGKVKTSDAFLQFPQSLLFSLHVYCKNHGADFKVDTSGAGWQALRAATEARNRVIHPKSAESLSLTDPDLRALMDASRWWQATLLAMFRACAEADAYWQGQLSSTAREE